MKITAEGETGNAGLPAIQLLNDVFVSRRRIYLFKKKKLYNNSDYGLHLYNSG